MSREEGVGLIAAGGPLDFFLAKTGSGIYNRTVADVLKRMQEHFLGIDIDIDIDIDGDSISTINDNIDFREEACLLSSRSELQPLA